jgi:hypothetical protein
MRTAKSSEIAASKTLFIEIIEKWIFQIWWL